MVKILYKYVQMLIGQLAASHYAKKRAQSIQGIQTIVVAAEESTFEAILNT